MRPQMKNPENENRRLEPMGLGTPDKTSELTGSGKVLALQDAEDQVLGLVWNRTEVYLWSKPRQLAGYPDPLLALAEIKPGQRHCQAMMVRTWRP